MMQRTKIEYLDYTWNPIAMRCTPCSPGCANCWHLRTADRLSKNPFLSGKQKDAYAGYMTKPYLVWKKLEEPWRAKKPARIGVQFMGDWMHPNVPDEYIGKILAVVKDSPQHTFITLTKRLPRLLDLKLKLDIFENLWNGVTVCDQAEADEKIPILLKIPAAVRWVSIEPILGPVNLSAIVMPSALSNGLQIDAVAGKVGYPGSMISDCPKIDWIVIGQETGPGARPAKAEWFNDVIAQCREAGVPVFVKKAPEGVDIIREYPACIPPECGGEWYAGAWCRECNFKECPL